MSLSHDDAIIKRFGARIAVVRRARGLTQQQVAETIGTSVVAVAYIETGKRWPRLATLSSISRALNVPISEFFMYIDEPGSNRSTEYHIDSHEAAI